MKSMWPSWYHSKSQTEPLPNFPMEENSIMKSRLGTAAMLFGFIVLGAVIYVCIYFYSLSQVAR
jgi:hypothetical protein